MKDKVQEIYNLCLTNMKNEGNSYKNKATIHYFCLFSYSYCTYIFKILLETERNREHMEQGLGEKGQRSKERESQADAALNMESYAGFNPATQEIMT